eukprot:1358495-Rhodomonas_salina.1
MLIPTPASLLVYAHTHTWAFLAHTPVPCAVAPSARCSLSTGAQLRSKSLAGCWGAGGAAGVQRNQGSIPLLCYALSRLLCYALSTRCPILTRGTWLLGRSACRDYHGRVLP